MRLLPFVVAEHYELVYLLAERSPQERDDLRTGAVIARRKGCLAHARGHAVHVAPRHRFIRPFGHIGERQVEHPRAREALTLRLSAAVDHGRSLRAGADAVCAEGHLRQTGDDAGAHRPADCLGIICALVHIGKRHQVIHHGGTSRAPEEGHDLSAVAGLVRCKEAVTNAAGDAVLRRPLDRLIKALETRIKSLYAPIVEEMGTACKGSCEQGGECFKVSYNPLYREGISKDRLSALRAQYPDIYDEFVDQTESRIFKVVKSAIA